MLVYYKFLLDLGAALLRQNVLELDIKLFFLLDQDVLFRDLLGLGDESLLQRLDLLNQLISLDVGGLKLAPSMHVQLLAELILEEFVFLLLLEEFF